MFLFFFLFNEASHRLGSLKKEKVRKKKKTSVNKKKCLEKLSSVETARAEKVKKKAGYT